jgi:hypothetical protein
LSASTCKRSFIALYITLLSSDVVYHSFEQ